jgi:hypothetical protein
VSDAEREHERQQQLLQSLWRRQPDGQFSPRLKPSRLQERGLQAYRANAGANAERALASDFPTVRTLIGEESFAGLARACWHACPPSRGDMACFGDALPSFIEAEARLAELPYLADVARLDRLLAKAESAEDLDPAPQSFELLGTEAPEHLRFILAPGCAVLRSRYPVVTLWQAHQVEADSAQLFDAAAAALREGKGETALVWRQGWKGRVGALSDAEAAWCRALLAGESVGHALSQAGEAFAFEPWLLQALSQARVLGVRKQ